MTSHYHYKCATSLKNATHLNGDANFQNYTKLNYIFLILNLKLKKINLFYYLNIIKHK